MTQEQLALACGWGQSRIANYESKSAEAREPKASEIQMMAKALNCTVGELFGESSAPSHDLQLDTHRLGVALTSIDKALADRRIQGKLGTLADAVQFAYGRAFRIDDPNSKSQLALFDDLVAQHLGRWDGREGDVEASEGEHREAAAPPQENRTGTG